MTGVLAEPPLEPIEIDRWTGPFSETVRRRAVEALERGMVLYFPKPAFRLEESERGLFSPALADRKAKNISLDPKDGSLRGTAAAGGERLHLQAVMESFAMSATQLMRELFPAYAARLERARTSYRPVEIAGRPYSPLKDDKLLHVDAFPSTPTCGRRILRFFANVHPTGKPRLWHVGEPFESFAVKFLPRLPRPSPLAAWLLAAVGATRGRRSAYDQLMLGLHDGAKRDAAYQAEAPRAEIAFPAGSCWLCYTDQVLHAALEGQYALEQTFHLDVEAMSVPARAPLKTLERLAGRALR
jgi:hypothetical protein